MHHARIPGARLEDLGRVVLRRPRAGLLHVCGCVGCVLAWRVAQGGWRMERKCPPEYQASPDPGLCRGAWGLSPTVGAWDRGISLRL